MLAVGDGGRNLTWPYRSTIAISSTRKPLSMNCKSLKLWLVRTHCTKAFHMCELLSTASKRRVPTCLGRIANEGLILLSASPNAGARTVKGSGVQSEANEGGQMYGWNITDENGEVVIGSRHEAHRIYGKQLMYYTISRAFIGIPSIIVSYSFPHTLYSNKKRRKNSQQYAAQS